METTIMTLWDVDEALSDNFMYISTLMVLPLGKSYHIGRVNAVVGKAKWYEATLYTHYNTPYKSREEAQKTLDEMAGEQWFTTTLERAWMKE